MVRRPLIATPHLGPYNILETRLAVEEFCGLNGG